jgi:hypothetical protein
MPLLWEFATFTGKIWDKALNVSSNPLTMLALPSSRIAPRCLVLIVLPTNATLMDASITLM